MRFVANSGAVGVVAFLLMACGTKPAQSALSPEDGPSAVSETGSCGNHGTSVHFLPTPSEAAGQAKREQKLVFVLHLSGIFEDPALT